MKFNLLYFIRLFSKHLFLIVSVPIVLAAIVYFLTNDEPRTYSSQAIINTSLASGSSIDLTTLTYNNVNTAFDNLIGIIRSRETVEDVGLRLLASHLALNTTDSMIILPSNLAEVMETIPGEIKNLRVPGDFEKTYANLKENKAKSGDNVVANIVEKKHPFYGAETIQNKLRANRLQSSDNLELSFESSDPGVCQNTLLYLIDVYRKAYIAQQSGQSDNAVAYFEAEVAKAALKLKESEDELLSFNQQNQIINYDEQSKFIAGRKEDFEAGYQDVLTQNSSSKAIITLLEQKMSPEIKRRLTGSELLTLREQLAKTNQEIAFNSSITNDADDYTKAVQNQKLTQKAADLKSRMRMVVDSLYEINNSISGIPTNSIISDWLTNVIDYEGTKAQLLTLDTLRMDFIRIYSQYAPMGASMRRLERKISVNEDEYISLVKSLGLAKLKQQSAEASSGGTVLDPPYYPTSPQADKRKIMIAAAALLGFLLILFILLIIDLLDTTLRTASRTQAATGLDVEGIYPAILPRKATKINLGWVEQKSTEVLARKLVLQTLTLSGHKKPFVIVVFSTREAEGKSFLLARVSQQLAQIGHKVLLLNPHESGNHNNFEQVKYNMTNQFCQTDHVAELPTPGYSPDWEQYDFIFIELPGLLHSTYPVNLLKNADRCVLVCQANRSWSTADRNVLAEVLNLTQPVKPQVLLNGVELEEMETILGELPRKRSWLRSSVKNVVTRQSKTKSIA